MIQHHRLACCMPISCKAACTLFSLPDCSPSSRTRCWFAAGCVCLTADCSHKQQAMWLLAYSSFQPRSLGWSEKKTKIGIRCTLKYRDIVELKLPGSEHFSSAAVMEMHYSPKQRGENSSPKNSGGEPDVAHGIAYSARTVAPIAAVWSRRGTLLA